MVVFAHRPPGVLRFAAYSAAAVDLAFGAALVVMGTQTPGAHGLQFGGIVLIAVSWLPPWVLLAVRYELDAGGLVVRRGPVRRRIAFDAMEEVRRSAPLPGLDGVIVRYRRRVGQATLPLYPEDPVGFLRQVQASATHLELVAEGVLRRRR